MSLIQSDRQSNTKSILVLDEDGNQIVAASVMVEHSAGRRLGINVDVHNADMVAANLAEITQAVTGYIKAQCDGMTGIGLPVDFQT